MKPEQRFDDRMAVIHGLGGSRAGVETFAGTMDIRRAEFDAMMDAFLGENYDGTRRQQIESIQLAAESRQAVLSTQHARGELTDEEYVDAANALIADMFKQCEKVLGEVDFEKLFGAPSREASQLIDPNVFMGTKPETGRHATDESPMFAVYTNFCRLSVMPDELILDFGLNTDMSLTPTDPLKLTSRLIMNYFTAKRLLGALMNVVKQHENSYGTLELDFRQRMRQQRRSIGAAAD